MILPSLKTLVHAEAFSARIYIDWRWKGYRWVLGWIICIRGAFVCEYACGTRIIRLNSWNFSKRSWKKRKRHNLYSHIPWGDTGSLSKSVKKHSHLSLVTIEEGQFPFRYDIFYYWECGRAFLFEDGEFRAIRIASREYADSQRYIWDLAWLGGTGFVTS